MNNLKDKEMRFHFISTVLVPGDRVVSNSNEEGNFVEFPTTYYGRLRNPGCTPGKYLDKSKIIVKVDNSLKLFDLSDIRILDFYYGRLDKLPKNWFLINLASNYIEPLPKTLFVEGDIVRLKDKSHNFYSNDLSINQFTVYQIDFESTNSNTIYKLRSGKKLFFAKEDQLEFLASGPVKIYESGQSVSWGSSKAEAEFYFLIGKYSRIFNMGNMSYKWSLDKATEMVELGKAHAVVELEENSEVSLILFDNDDFGREIASSGLILKP